MPYPYESYPVTGAGIRSAAEATSGRVAAVNAVVSQVEADHRGALSAVSGQLQSSVADAPKPTIEHASDIQQKAIYAAGCLEYFAHAVDIYNTDGISPRSVKTLNSDWEALAANNFGVTMDHTSPDAPDSVVTAAETRDTNAASAARTSQQRVFEAEYAQLGANLDTTATDTQSKLNRGPNANDILDLYSWGALPVFAALIWPNVDFSHQYLPPEKAQELATDLADQVNANKVDADTVAMLNLYHDNPAFAAAFWQHTSPRQVSNAIDKLELNAYPDDSSGRTAEQTLAARNLYKDFVLGTGVTLATYTSQTDEYAPPADYATTWADAITGHPSQATELGLLFRYAGDQASFGPQFLADVTDKVYDYEIKTDTPGMWQSAALNPKFINPDGELGHSYDPIAQLLSAMDKSPTAAYLFFNDSDTVKVKLDGNDVDVNSKLYYLLVERRTPTDDGDGLGQALEGLTLGDRETHPYNAAMMASQTMALIADKTGDGDTFIKDDGWQIPHGMTDSIGSILAGYMPDVYRISTATGDSNEGNDWVFGDDGSEKYPDGYPDGLPLGLNVSKSDLGLVLQSMGHTDDKTGLELTTASALNFNRELELTALHHMDMQDGVAGNLTQAQVLDSATNTEFTGSAVDAGSTLNFILKNGANGGHELDSLNEQQSEVLGKAWDVASLALPEIKNPLTSYLTDEGLSYLKDQLTGPHGTNTDDWVTNTNNNIQSTLEFQTYDSLVSAGVLHAPAEFTTTDGAGQTVIDPKFYEAIIHPDSNSIDDSKLQDEFNTWFQNLEDKKLASEQVESFIAKAQIGG